MLDTVPGPQDAAVKGTTQTWSLPLEGLWSPHYKNQLVAKATTWAHTTCPWRTGDVPDSDEGD